MSEKAVIFDSGTLINLSLNGLLYVVEHLKKNFKGKFLITQQVKYETVDRPLGISKFELGAVRVQNLIDLGVLEFPDSVEIDQKIIEKRTLELKDTANHYLQTHGKWVSIVSDAEMSCLALSDALREKGIDNIIAIDERTTRLLAEKPENLERIMSDKLHQKVQMVAKDFAAFEKYKFIRSSEMVWVAYKKGLINLKGNRVLEALLYATKFHGSSISFEEIDQLKKI